MRAGDGDGAVPLEQRGEGLRPQQDPGSAGARGGQLGVGLADRAADDDGVGVRLVGRVVPDVDDGAQRLQLAQRPALLGVAAR